MEAYDGLMTKGLSLAIGSAADDVGLPSSFLHGAYQLQYRVERYRRNSMEFQVEPSKCLYDQSVLSFPGVTDARYSETVGSVR